MRKPALAAVLVLGMVSAASGLTWRTDSVQAALAQAKAENKLLLIDFFTEYG